MFARLIESLDQHNIRVLPSMKITLIYSRQDIPTKWESWEISHKSLEIYLGKDYLFICSAGLIQKASKFNYVQSIILKIYLFCSLLFHLVAFETELSQMDVKQKRNLLQE